MIRHTVELLGSQGSNPASQLRTTEIGRMDFPVIGDRSFERHIRGAINLSHASGADGFLDFKSVLNRALIGSVFAISPRCR